MTALLPPPVPRRAHFECVTAGADRVHLRIAGIDLAVRSLHPELRLGVADAYLPFLRPTGRARVEAQVSLGRLGPEEPAELLFDSGSLWRLYGARQELVFRMSDSRLAPVPYKEARFSPTLDSGEVTLHRPLWNGETVYPLDYPLDELLVMHLLGAGLGVELHACGVVDADGRGYLFAGQSGHGKTTTARLWEQEAGVTVLSDDRIILRREGGRVRMFGTPWHGDAGLAAAESVRLDGVFFLKRGAENRWEPVSAAGAVSRLLARSFVPFHRPDALAFTLSFLEELVREVPCRDFPFVPDGGAVEFVRRWSHAA